MYTRGNVSRTMLLGTELLESIDLGAAPNAAEPKWQKLFPIGTRHRADFPKGGIAFTADSLKSMVDVWTAEGKPERAVNFFHRGASGAPGSVDEKVAAGWIKNLELRADGLYGLINWTERARGYITKDELRYLSPEFALSGTDKLTGKPHGPKLLGAALLNDPFLVDLPRVAASETPGENKLKSLIELLKLAETATEADIEAAVKALAEKAATVDAEAVKLSESATKLAEVEAAVTKLTADLTAAQAETSALKSAAVKAEVNAFVEKLVLAGRVAPAIRESVTKLGETSGIEAIKFFENAPQVIDPKKEIGVSGSATQGDEAKVLAKKFNDRVAELQGKGLNFTEAFNTVRGEMPNEFREIYK